MTKQTHSGGEPPARRRAFVKRFDRKTVSSGKRFWTAALGATLINVAFAAAATFGLSAFGLGVFLAAPLLAGVVGALIAGDDLNGAIKPIALAAAITMLSMAVLLVTSLEGIACVLLALPLVAPAVFSGVVAGIVVAHGTSRLVKRSCVGAFIMLPLATMGVENAVSTDYGESTISTIVVDAPPETVWDYVIAFPEIPEFSEEEVAPWTFALGYPQPRRCEIEGSGAGAMRYCIFDDGQFDEPVQVWKPVEELTFGVADQPKRLDPYLQITRGQFLLEDLGDGRTRITGTTWFTSSVAPQWYWEWWCDQLLHDIHGRVLDHIKRLAEEDAKRTV